MPKTKRMKKVERLVKAHRQYLASESTINANRKMRDVMKNLKVKSKKKGDQKAYTYYKAQEKDYERLLRKNEAMKEERSVELEKAYNSIKREEGKR